MSALIGINTAGRGEHRPADLAASGARWVRAVAYPDTDISGWIQDCRARNIDVLLVLARESFDGFASWSDGLAHYARRYGGLVSAIQCGNESDHVSPSSWTLKQTEVNQLLMLARQALPGKTIVGPGLVSGQPSWVGGLDLNLLDFLALHPYGQSPGKPEDWPWLPGNFGQATDLVSRYAVYGKPIWITEVGLSSDQVTLQQQASYCSAILTALSNHPAVQRAAWFCWSDDMVPRFGLRFPDGSPKPSYDAFQRLVLAQPQPEPAPMPIYSYQLGIKTKAEQLKAAGFDPGKPLESEDYPFPNAPYSFQFSERGLFVYSKKADRVHFFESR